MDIQALKLRITDADLASLIRQRLAEEEGLEGIQASILPEGVKLQGEYPTGFGFKVPFETVWQVSAEGSVVRAKLDVVKVAGMPAGMLRGALMRMLRDAAEQQAGVRIEEETVLTDLAVVAYVYGFDVRLNLTGFRLSAGELVVEAS